MAFHRDLFVFVHHPRHDLAVGVDVGSRHVFRNADDRRDRADVSAGEAFFFGIGEFFRIADNAALTAAKRNIDDGALPSHPAGEGANGVNRFGREPTDTAFCRTSRRIILNAETLENSRGAVVHFDGKSDPDFALRGAQQLGGRFVESQHFRSLEDALFRNGERITFVSHNDSPV